jgi:predicted kinase
MPMPTAHLVHGFLGVGKTTFAKQLERRLPAIRFSHDEWMVRFYGTDPSADLFATYSRKVTDQISLLWPRCLELGVDVVIDAGLWSRTERDEARQRARACGADVMLYRVNCADHIARARLRARNASLDGDLLITDATYDLLKARFEPLDPEEERQEVQG